MPDPLHRAIELAIQQPVNSTAFERCAVEVLRQSEYPKLRGTPEKRDAGIDGLSGPDAEPEFVLVATTAQDYARNLRTSVASYVGNGGLCRSVVFATTREVTAKRRLALQQELAAKWDLRLHAVHDRGDFVRLLYHDSQWRKELLGVAGAARALSRFPASSRATLQVPVVGRDRELDHLRTHRNDLLLVGRPGVGKTFLLESLVSEGWGLFDAGWSIADLEDAIRDLGPRRVVLDDAHLNSDRLFEILRLRREMEGDFAITAVSWPGQADTVARHLPEAERFEVAELDRDQIVQVIAQAGVIGPPDLQRVINDQAHGCVGLAVALARACVAGRIGAVATGEALLTDLVGWYGRTLGEDSRHALGVLALAGDRGATLAQVCESLDLSAPRVSDLVRGLASGGTVDEAPHYVTLDEFFKKAPTHRELRMRVQPEPLRYALVRSVFYGGPGSLEASQVTPNLDSSATAIPLIGAVHRGARVNRGLIEAVMDWSDEESVTAYAALGRSELLTALEKAPALQTHIAEAAWKAGLPDDSALQALMAQAVGDDRPEHSTPDHPLRIVGDRLAHPNTTMNTRRAAVVSAGTWLERGGDAEVGLRVMMHAVQPKVSGISQDPGIGRTFTIQEGAVPKEWIDQLSDIWDLILAVVERNPTLPTKPVLAGLHPWVYPDVIGFGQGAAADVAEAMLSVTTRVISRLAGIYQDRPGVLHRLRQYARDAELPISFDVPHEFMVLFPDDPVNSAEYRDYEEWEHRTDAAVNRLAEELRERSSDAVLTLLTNADAEAAAADIRFPRKTPLLAQLLADESDEPEVLLSTMIECSAAPDLILPFFERSVELRRPNWEVTLERLLADADLSGVAVRVALTRPCDKRLKQLSIQRAASWLNLIELLVIRREVNDETLGLLLDAPDLSVRQKAAVTLLSLDSKDRLQDLPLPIRARYRTILVHCPAGDGMFAHLLKQHAQLCADWLRAWFDRLRSSEPPALLQPGIEDAVANLPVDLRTSLIADLPSDVPGFLIDRAVQGLVSDDLAVAAALFERSDVASLHEIALRKGPSEAWMERASLAVEHGWSPEQVVGPTRLSENPRSGEESHYCQRKIEEFELLRPLPGQPNSQRKRIVAAGIAYFTQLREEADRRERRERVFGDQGR